MRELVQAIDSYVKLVNLEVTSNPRATAQSTEDVQTQPAPTTQPVEDVIERPVEDVASLPPADPLA